MTPYRINSHKILKEIPKKKEKKNKANNNKKNKTQINYENYEYIFIISPAERCLHCHRLLQHNPHILDKLEVLETPILTERYVPYTSDWTDTKKIIVWLFVPMRKKKKGNEVDVFSMSSSWDICGINVLVV